MVDSPDLVAILQVGQVGLAPRLFAVSNVSDWSAFSIVGQVVRLRYQILGLVDFEAPRAGEQSQLCRLMHCAILMVFRVHDLVCKSGFELRCHRGTKQQYESQHFFQITNTSEI